MTLKKVISGGQIGIDQAAIFAAHLAEIETGGWAPKGWKTLHGKAIMLRHFGLKEHPGGYKARTWANVRDSDGTLRLAVDFNSPGEICTLNAIKHFKKPYFDIDLKTFNLHVVITRGKVSPIRAWLKENKIQTLNVAGNADPKLFPIGILLLLKLFQKRGKKL